MPYIQKKSELITKKCESSSCKENIGNASSYVECDNCKKAFHLKCKLITKSSQISTIAASGLWYCSKDCTPITPRKLRSNSTTDSTIGTSFESTSSMNPEPTNGLSMDTFSVMKAQFDAQRTVFQTLNDNFKGMSDMLQGLERSQQFISEEFENIKKLFENMEKENKNMKNDINEMKIQISQQQSTINNLEMSADHENQLKNRNDLIIANLPNQIEKTDLINAIIKTLDATTNSADILDSFYLSKQRNQQQTVPTTTSNGNNQPTENNTHILLVRFKSAEAKNHLLLKKKEKKLLFAKQIGFESSDEHQIYIREHLPPLQSHLFLEARKYQTSHNIKYVWFKEGVRIRQDDKSKIYNINSRNDLARIDVILNNNNKARDPASGGRRINNNNKTQNN